MFHTVNKDDVNTAENIQRQSPAVFPTAQETMLETMFETKLADNVCRQCNEVFIRKGSPAIT